MVGVLLKAKANRIAAKEYTMEACQLTATNMQSDAAAEYRLGLSANARTFESSASCRWAPSRWLTPGTSHFAKR
jgi:hypothetical protein